MSKDELDEFEDAIKRLLSSKFSFFNGLLAFQGILIAISVGLLAISQNDPLIKILSALSTWLLIYSSYLIIRIIRNFVRVYQIYVDNIKVHDSWDLPKKEDEERESIVDWNKQTESEILLFVETSMVILSICILLLLL